MANHFIRPENLDDIARDFGLGKYAPSPAVVPALSRRSNQAAPSGEFSIEELSDRYRLQGLPHNGELRSIDWSKELLDEGQTHSQAEWTQLLHNQEFQIPSTQVYSATCHALHQHKNGAQAELVKKVRALLKKDFVNSWMMTSTLVQYHPAAPDTLFHDYGTLREASAAVEFVGPDGFFLKDSFEHESQALFGTGDVQEVGEVWHWITGKKPYLWRFNSRPAQTEERCVVLGVYGDGFSIGANAGSSRWPARGVVVPS